MRMRVQALVDGVHGFLGQLLKRATGRDRRWVRPRSVVRAGAALFAALSVLLSTLSGCRSSSLKTFHALVRCEVKPQPPRVGKAVVVVTLAEPGGAPIEGASVSVEGNMSHPGMQPVYIKTKEISPGRYEAPMNFTMGGDWFLTVTASQTDGSTVEKQFPVPGVLSK